MGSLSDIGRVYSHGPSAWIFLITQNSLLYVDRLLMAGAERLGDEKSLQRGSCGLKVFAAAESNQNFKPLA